AVPRVDAARARRLAGLRDADVAARAAGLLVGAAPHAAGARGDARSLHALAAGRAARAATYEGLARAGVTAASAVPARSDGPVGRAPAGRTAAAETHEQEERDPDRDARTPHRSRGIPDPCRLRGPRRRAARRAYISVGTVGSGQLTSAPG